MGRGEIVLATERDGERGTLFGRVGDVPLLGEVLLSFCPLEVSCIWEVLDQRKQGLNRTGLNRVEQY